MKFNLNWFYTMTRGVKYGLRGKENDMDRALYALRNGKVGLNAVART
jgi:hypothetical protein